jgi:hypothetical protein
MTYAGQAQFLRRDSRSKVMVIEGSGRDSRGTGTASGTATVTLTADSPTSTRVDVLTEFTVTGKAAQFGRGVMQDVAGRIVDQFAANLAAALESRSLQPTITAGAAAPQTSGLDEGSAEPRPITALPAAKRDDSIDLLGTAGAPVVKRVLPVVVAAMLVGVIIWWFRR